MWWLRWLPALLLPALATGAETPDTLQQQFDSAVEAIEADRLRTARETLQGILTHNPSLHRARLELARVYYLTEDYAAARGEAQRVLDDPNTPPQVRATVLAFLAQIAADEKRGSQRHRFTPAFYGGIMYDSNVNFGPSRDVIDIGGVSFPVAGDSREESDMAAVVAPGITHTWNPGRRFQAGEHTGFFVWQSQANAYYRAYADESDFNLGILTARTGPAWMVPRHWRASLGLQADQIWLGGDSLALFTTLNPTVTWELDRRTELTLDGVYTRRGYYDDEDDGRDGDYTAADVVLTRYYQEGRLGLQGGGGWVNFDADEPRFSHDGPELFGGVMYQAWPDGAVFARIAWREYDYDGVEPLFNIQRDDDEVRYTMGFQHNIQGGLLARWAVQGSWLFTDNDSNVAIYDYDRHQVSLGLARTF